MAPVVVLQVRLAPVAAVLPGVRRQLGQVAGRLQAAPVDVDAVAVRRAHSDEEGGQFGLVAAQGRADEDVLEAVLRAASRLTGVGAPPGESRSPGTRGGRPAQRRSSPRPAGPGRGGWTAQYAPSRTAVDRGSGSAVEYIGIAGAPKARSAVRAASSTASGSICGLWKATSEATRRGTMPSPGQSFDLLDRGDVAGQHGGAGRRRDRGDQVGAAGQPVGRLLEGQVDHRPWPLALRLAQQHGAAADQAGAVGHAHRAGGHRRRDLADEVADDGLRDDAVGVPEPRETELHHEDHGLDAVDGVEDRRRSGPAGGEADLLQEDRLDLVDQGGELRHGERARAPSRATGSPARRTPRPARGRGRAARHR